MHYYQHHIGDFIKATARLSDAQSMAYLRLIWMYYDKEKPLKPDTKLLAFQIGSTPEDTGLILESFFVLCEDGWHNTRCDKEIAEYHAMLDKRSSAGRASAERRKNKSSAFDEQVLNTSSTDVQLTNNHKPINNNQEPKRETRAVALSCPPDVNPQVWADWLHLRKTKKASVTETVVNGARAEAQKAGMPLQAFLEIWCLRGSQGLQAEWIKPEEKNQALSKTGQMNQRVMSGLTRGLIGGTGNVKLLGK